MGSLVAALPAGRRSRVNYRHVAIHSLRSVRSIKRYASTDRGDQVKIVVFADADNDSSSRSIDNLILNVLTNECAAYMYILL